MLETNGWLELKTVRYKSHLIDRVVIPLEAESRWCEAFGLWFRPTKKAARFVNFRGA